MYVYIAQKCDQYLLVYTSLFVYVSTFKILFNQLNYINQINVQIYGSPFLMVGLYTNYANI